MPGVQIWRRLGDRAGHHILSGMRPTDVSDRRNDSAQLAPADPEVACGRLAVVHYKRRGLAPRRCSGELKVGYKTAWLMLQKLRGAMVRADRCLLSKMAEVDETYVGGEGKNRTPKKTMPAAKK
jgi:hypothetical protein